MTPERTSYFFFGSFVASVFLLQWWQRASYPRALWLLFLFAVPQALCVTWARRILLPCLLGMMAASYAVAHTTHAPHTFTVDSYANGESVTLQGVIAEEPDRRPMQTKYTVAVNRLEDASGKVIEPLEGKVLVTDHEGWPEFLYGDTVEVSGKMEKPEAIEDFRYDHYLSRFGVYSVVYRARITRIGENEGHPAFVKLYAIKQHFERQISRLYAEPHTSFLAGLLTGSRRGIPEHLQEAFQRTGLTHIIAISGYNITIIIAVITGCLFWLPLRWRFVPAAVAIIAFTVFVGASAAVVRASIMGILGLLALQTGRIAHVRLAVLWTLFFMLVVNPKYLWYDAGFQLSFLAVAGLTELSPLLDRFFERIPKILGIREALQMTVAAQIAAVPLIVSLFGQLSLIAPLANILVAPAIPFAMLFGFLGTVVSFFWFRGGQILAFIGWGFLEWMIIVADLLSKLPFASVSVPYVQKPVVILYYILLVLILVRFTTRTRRSSSCLSTPAPPASASVRAPEI